MPLVAQHRFVAILRDRGWRAPIIGTWTADATGTGVAPDGTRVRWTAPAASDDRNEKGTWSSVWLDPDALAAHADVAMAAEVADLGDDVLTGPLSPQGHWRRRGLDVLLARAGLDGLAAVEGVWLRVGGAAIHLSSGAVRAQDGSVRPRDLGLDPLPGLSADPALGRILAEARRLAGAG